MKRTWVMQKWMLHTLASANHLQDLLWPALVTWAWGVHNIALNLKAALVDDLCAAEGQGVHDMALLGLRRCLSAAGEEEKGEEGEREESLRDC